MFQFAEEKTKIQKIVSLFIHCTEAVVADYVRN